MNFLFEFNRFSLHIRGEQRGEPGGEQKNHKSNCRLN